MKGPDKLKISLLNFDILTKILKHILLCKLAYKTPEELFNILNDDEYNSVKNLLNEQHYYNNSETDCQAYSWKYKNILYVIFRGTSSLKDAIIDLKVSLTNFENKSGVYVHKGFHQQFKSIENEILNNIDDNITKISVSGHSLGGGIACIAAATFALKFPDKEVSCYTYGCPRPGNLMFKKIFKNNVKKYYRIVMNDDPITMVPTNCFYNHVCKGINIKDTLQVTYLDDIKWYKRSCYICGNLNYSDLFEAHHTRVYQDKIKELFNTDDNDFIDGNINSNTIDNSLITNKNSLLYNNNALIYNNTLMQNNLARGFIDYNLYILNCNNQLLMINNQLLNKNNTYYVPPNNSINMSNNVPYNLTNVA